MPIPKDAWNKMIEQLGNLFEAGRALATEAAARAKAETEVQFLRERVSDLEEQLERIAGVAVSADAELRGSAGSVAEEPELSNEDFFWDL